MKLSASTLRILKNFSAINPGIQFTPGKVLRTTNIHKNFFAKAVVEDEFTAHFNIYDLPQFISAISLYSAEEVDLVFVDKEVHIGGFGGRSVIKYRGCDANMIELPTEKMIAAKSLPNAEINFSLDEKEFKLILNSSSILSSPHVIVESSGNCILMSTYDINDDSSHKQSLQVGEWNESSNFKFIFKSENIAKILPGSYDVELSSKGMIHFTNRNIDLEYFMTVEMNSQFG
jgi:hypothetical protein